MTDWEARAVAAETAHEELLKVTRTLRRRCKEAEDLNAAYEAKLAKQGTPINAQHRAVLLAETKHADLTEFHETPANGQDITCHCCGLPARVPEPWMDFCNPCAESVLEDQACRVCGEHVAIVETPDRDVPRVFKHKGGWHHGGA